MNNRLLALTMLGMAFMQGPAYGIPKTPTDHIKDPPKTKLITQTGEGKLTFKVVTTEVDWFIKSNTEKGFHKKLKWLVTYNTEVLHNILPTKLANNFKILEVWLVQ